MQVKANMDLVWDRHYKKAGESGRAKDVDVAIHVRLGDVGQRRLPPSYFAAIARRLVDQGQCGASHGGSRRGGNNNGNNNNSNNNDAACSIAAHHNAEEEEEEELTGAFEEALAGLLGAANRQEGRREVDVRFHGKNTSLVAAYHQMIAADVFVASVSSFSNAVCLL